MKVYAVVENMGYDGDCLLGIFSTRERADEVATRIAKKHCHPRDGFYDVTVEVYKLDELVNEE